MTIMDRGLRERRAQIRAQKRAERLEAREKRTRSVRKSDDDADPFFSYTPKRITEERARDELINEYKAESDASGRVAAPRFDMSPGAVKTRVENERKAQEEEERKAQAGENVARINKDNSINNYQVPEKYAETPTGTMAEIAAGDKRAAAREKREKAREKVMSDDTLSEEERLAELKKIEDVYTSDFKGATAEKLQEQAVYDPDKVVTPETDEQKEVREQALKDRYAEGAARISERFADDDNKVVDASDDTVVTEGPMGEGEVDENALLAQQQKADAKAYAKEMEQTKYNIMRDNAGKFLRSFAQAGVDNIDKINTAGWDMAGNMVKAMFTRPEALSSASRVIGSAMSMNEAVGRMAEDTSKRYGIAVQADPELIKDTIKYKAYKRAKDIDGKVMGNAMKALDDSLKALGVEDISQLDETQLASYRNNVESEMERIRGLLQTDQKVRTEAREKGPLAEIKSGFEGLRGDFRKNKYNYNRPEWNGRLHSDDRTMLMRTYDVLTDHVKELDKHANQLSKEEKARVMEARRRDKESRMRAYDASPIGFVLKELSPEFRLEVGQDGLPRNLRDYSKVENMIARMEADDRAAYGDDDTLWRHTAAEYQAARDLMKKSRDDIFNTKNAIAISAYESSPYNWVLKEAFPNYNVPVDENTGLPTDMRHVNKIRQTVEVLRKQDSLKSNPIRPDSAYETMIRNIDAYKENVRKQGNISKLRSYGGEAVSLSDNVPTLTRDASIIDSTGYWGASAKASMDHLWLRLGQLDAEIKAKGGNPADDPRYKHAYCMYSGAKYSRMMTGCANFISNIPITRLIRHGVNPAKRDADLNILSQLLKDSARNYFPLDEAKAAQLNLNDVYNQGQVLEDIISRMRQTYSFTKSNPTTSNTATSNPATSNAGPSTSTNTPPAPVSTSTTPPNISPSFKRDTKENAERSLKSMLKNDIAEFRNAFANLKNGGDAYKDFEREYDNLTDLVRFSLDHDDPNSPIPDWYSNMNDMEKEAYVADLVDKWSYMTTRGKSLPRFPDTTGRSTFKDGDAAPEIEYAIDPASYKISGSSVKDKWNKAFVEALYEKVNGEWVLRDPFVAGAYLLRLSHKSGQNPQSLKPLTYEKAVNWVQQYSAHVKELKEHADSDNSSDTEGGEQDKLLIIPTEGGVEQSINLEESVNAPSEETSTKETSIPLSGDQIPPNSDSRGEQTLRYGKFNLNDLLNSEDEDVREILNDYLHIISDGSKSDYLRDTNDRIILKMGNLTRFLEELKEKGIEISNPYDLFAKPVDKTVYKDSGIENYAEYVKAAKGAFNDLKNKFPSDFITNSNLNKHTSPESMLDQYLKQGVFAEAYDAIKSKLGAGWHEESGEGYDEWKAYYEQMWDLANLLENRMKQGEMSYPIKTTDEREMSFRFKNPRNKDIEESGTENFMPPTLNERPEFIPTTPKTLKKWAENIVDAYKSKYEPDKYSDKIREANVNRLVDLYNPSLREFLLDDNRNVAKERYGKLFDDWEVWDRFGKLPLGESGLRADLINWEGLQQSASIKNKVKSIQDEIAADNRIKEEEERRALENIVRENLRRYLFDPTRIVGDEQTYKNSVDELVDHILSKYKDRDTGKLTYKVPGQKESTSVNLSKEGMDFKKSKAGLAINQLIKSAIYNDLKNNMGEDANIPSFTGKQLGPYLKMIEDAFGKDQNGVDIPVNSNIYNLLRKVMVPRASTRKSRNPNRVQEKGKGREVKEGERSETPSSNVKVTLPNEFFDELNGRGEEFKKELFDDMKARPEVWRGIIAEIHNRKGGGELLTSYIKQVFDGIQ